MAKQGGKRPGAGRKPKADEDRIRRLSINAMATIFGSEEKAFEHIAKLAEKSYPHLKLLMAYAYGNPKDKLEVKQGFVEQPLFTKNGVRKNNSDREDSIVEQKN